MKIASCIWVISLIWLMNCVASNKISDDLFILLWSPIIAELNESSANMPFGAEIKTNLLEKHAEELKIIKNQWESLDKNNLEKNKFFNAKIEELNDRDFSQLLTDNTPKDYWRLAQKILNIIHTNQTASLNNINSYEEGTQIGFCFGRALLVHYLLIKAGVPQEDILKTFMFGKIKVGHQFWHFHVTVMVKDKDDFIVIDPLAKEPMKLRNWMAENRRYEIKYPWPRLRFYFTDPRKFLPASAFYNLDDLSNPALKNYFQDLLKELNAMVQAVQRPFRDMG